ncbi:hypothetical protein N7466_003624 [Penicillium verhagenii]|uniref:uncharacterized protein n=1 Tax=Penicillium verhagenii TaxID=1562060 RepID=UPI002544DFE7|nr:uncharacterized protein N7466_003624 [Penicillium verhagenii]KAJ5934077.1 hypothetical protein N7466_003624 [Penicillium verhagenii]
MLTDMFLHDFLVSILPTLLEDLPTLLEDRLLLDPQLVQKASLALLAESALVSFTISPFIHHHVDRLENDNWLLAGLIGELLGSMAVASANSLSILFSGRFVQAVANTSVGILGLTSLSRKVSTDELDKINGIITVALAMGSTAGPLIAGSLLQLAGYWRAWNYAFIASLVGIGLQFLMVDTKKPQMHGRPRPADQNSSEASVVDEQSPLIPTLVTENAVEIQGLLSWKRFNMTLYVYLFRNSQYIGGIVSSICYAVVSSSFSTTLPLHVRHVFNWGSLPTGLLFGAIQGPNAFLGVPVAWLKKRIGTRHPTTFGFAILAIMLWLIGIPGEEKFPWFNRESRDEILYVTGVMGAGVSMSLLNGVGMMEATNAVYELETEHPEVFGKREGYTRAVFVTRMSWTLGTFVGPILSGTLSERIGYYAMNCVGDMHYVFPFCVLELEIHRASASRQWASEEVKTERSDKAVRVA